MTATARTRRKPAKTDTERALAVRACAAHLADHRAHAARPAEAKLPSRAAVRLVCPIPEASWCSSPARMCAELAE